MLMVARAQDAWNIDVPGVNLNTTAVDLSVHGGPSWALVVARPTSVASSQFATVRTGAWTSTSLQMLRVRSFLLYG